MLCSTMLEGMTTDNLTVVKGIYDAFARRDMEAIAAVVDPDVTIHQDAPLPWAGTFTGIAGFGEFLSRLLGHVEPPSRPTSSSARATVSSRSAEPADGCCPRTGSSTPANCTCGVSATAS